MSNARKNQIQRLISVLGIVLLCALISTSFAWFIFDETATVRNKSDMQITAGDRLEVSLDGKNWGHTLEPEFTKSPVLPDITGDGMTFYYPTVLDADDKTVQDPSSFYAIDMNKPDEVSMYMITFKLYFRSATDMDVYLLNTSYVHPGNTDVGADNKSMFGNISTDFIAGAARVAFLEEITEVDDQGNETVREVLKNIWIPNDKIQLSYNKGKAEIKTEGSRETFEGTEYPYGYMYIGKDEVVKDEEAEGEAAEGEATELVDVVKTNPYTWKDYGNRLISIGNGSLAIPATGGEAAKANHAAPLLSFSGEGGKIEEKVLIVRIWVEGTDREADKALVGGKMNYALDFVGIKKLDRQQEANKEDPENPVDILAGLSLTDDKTLLYDGAKPAQGLFEYSHDGITWITYDSQALNHDKKTEVFVRYKETATHLPSAIKVLSLVDQPEGGEDAGDQAG